jgi:hypothetical protein
MNKRKNVSWFDLGLNPDGVDLGLNPDTVKRATDSAWTNTNTLPPRESVSSVTTADSDYLDSLTASELAKIKVPTVGLKADSPELISPIFEVKPPPLGTTLAKNLGLNKAYETVAEPIKGAYKTVTSAANTAYDTVANAATTASTAVSNATTAVTEAANSVSTTVVDATTTIKAQLTLILNYLISFLRKITDFFLTNTYLKYLHLMFIVSVIVIIIVPIIKEVEQIRSENISNKENSTVKLREYLKSKTFEIVSVIILSFIFLILLFIVPESGVPSFFNIIQYVYLFIFICSIFGFVFGSHFSMAVGFFILFLLARYPRSHYFMPFAIIFILYIFRTFGVL